MVIRVGKLGDREAAVLQVLDQPCEPAIDIRMHATFVAGFSENCAGHLQGRHRRAGEVNIQEHARWRRFAALRWLAW